MGGGAADLRVQHFRDDIETMRIEAVSVNELSDGDIALRGQRRKQIKSLEDETDLVAAQFRARGIAHFVRSLPSTRTSPREALRQAADHVEERRFSASRWAHHGDRLAGRTSKLRHATPALPPCPRDTASTDPSVLSIGSTLFFTGPLSVSLMHGLS